MPAVPRVAGDWAMAFGRAAVVLTVAAWLALVFTVVNGEIEGGSDRAEPLRDGRIPPRRHRPRRLGDRLPLRPPRLLLPAKTNRRVPRAMIDEYFDERRPSVTVADPLLPGGARRDPDDAAVRGAAGVPGPARGAARSTTRRIPATPPAPSCSTAPWRCPAEIERLLSEPRLRFDRALERFEADFDPTSASRPPEDLRALAAEYEFAGEWLDIGRPRATRSPTTTSASSPTMCSASWPPTWRVTGRRAAGCRRRGPDEADPGRVWPSSTAGSPGPSAPRSRASSASVRLARRTSRTRR